MKDQIKMKKDLTQGDVLSQLIWYALPLIGTSLLQSVYSIVDIYFAGHTLGSVGISAINNSSQVINLLTKIAIGLSLGGNVLIGQYFGSRNESGKKKAIVTLFAVSMVFGILSAALFFFGAQWMLKLLLAPSLYEAVLYLKICAPGLIFICGYNGLSAIMRAVGDSQTPFRIVFVSTVLNIVLDYVFMYLFSFGVAGAALATVVSQGVCFFIAFIQVSSNEQIYGMSIKRIQIYLHEMVHIFRLSIPMVLQMTIAALSWLVVTYYINQYGVSVSAGNGISIKIKDSCQLIISALTSGAATMIAQNLGAKLFDRAKEILYTTLKLAVGISTILIILVEIFAPQFVMCFNTEPDVVYSAVKNLRIEILAQVFYAGFMTYHAMATGAGHTLFVMVSSFVNCILFRVILVILLNPIFGIDGVYWACMIAPSISIPLGMWYMKSNRWKRSIV